MKQTRYISAVLVLLSALAVASCKNFDYEELVAAGNPVVKAATVGSAEMGDSIDVKVTCNDTEGYDLSTLKAEMCYSGETVNAVTVRTKTPGEYALRLYVPFLRFIPNGKAQIRLTLQNVTTKATVENVDVEVTRPHFADLQFVSSDNVSYPMTEGDDYTYTCSVTVSENAFKGYFRTADGKYRFGAGDNDIAIGGTGLLSFQSNTVGRVTVTFNSRDFTYGPQEKLTVQPLQFRNIEGQDTFTGILTQGTVYKFIGDEAVQGNDWYYDTDFFTRNADGTFTFKALTGTYTIKAVFAENGFRIFAGDTKDPAKLNADGTGAVWIIGDAIFGKPTFAHAQGWWTDTDHALCMAPVADKIYQVTLTVGKQLKAGKSVNFKFFGQAGWGVEFKGTAGSHWLKTASATFLIGDGNGHDNGNIYLADGAELVDGETYVMTIDCSKGMVPATLSVEKK